MLQIGEARTNAHHIIMRLFQGRTMNNQAPSKHTGSKQERTRPRGEHKVSLLLCGPLTTGTLNFLLADTVDHN